LKTLFTSNVLFLAVSSSVLPYSSALHFLLPEKCTNTFNKWYNPHMTLFIAYKNEFT